MDKKNLDELKTTGFTMLASWRPELTTLQIAEAFGGPVDIPRLLRGSSVPVVQALVPRPVETAPKNQYSGTYGLAEFPLHTDLAHWATPPRYLLLRCVHGTPTVLTRILPLDALAAVVDKSIIGRAVFRPRKGAGGEPICPLPMSFVRSGVYGIRWDPLFLVPMNSPALDVAHAISSGPWETSMHSLALVNTGDTLVIDNWRALHGRSCVGQQTTGRLIERVYLNQIDG